MIIKIKNVNRILSILITILVIAVVVSIAFWIENNKNNYKPLNKYGALRICYDMAKTCGDGQLSIESIYRHECSTFFNYAKNSEEILNFANDLC